MRRPWRSDRRLLDRDRPGRTAKRAKPIPSRPIFRRRERYWVHWDKVVFAGTYKKTFTRLTTMEAACESGRHATNAIIDHYLYQQSGKTDQRDKVGYDWNVPAGFTTERFLSPVYQPTSIGHYCQIWNIEEHELPDLEVAKRVDQWCFDQNLPHPWEMLGLDNLASLSSSLGPLAENLVSPSPTLVDNLVSPSSPLGSLFGRLLRSGLSAADLLPFPDAASLLPVLTRLREAIESLLNRRDGD